MRTALEIGCADMSIEAIAARAGASKRTIHRRWSSEAAQRAVHHPTGRQDRRLPEDGPRPDPRRPHSGI
ncbi:TetR family transcriptional regulator [Nonomuraea sp. MG754425]|uniref:TetR family transcriptional regulator n=1 Tax=Nonomuraea sp. MG754425 TaxID=2570319 RepID=UPI0023516AFC|nr:TetR family transcriptional regulator [Nonomuraea sp. MG754425]